MKSIPGLFLAVLLLFTSARAWAALDLQNLGSGQFIVDPGATTASYAQTTNALIFSGTYPLGEDTLGGLFDGAPRNWSGFTGFGLSMVLNNNSQPSIFTVSFYDTAFNVINTYQGDSFGLSGTPSLVTLTLLGQGTEDFSEVVGMQFTWESGGAIDASITEVVGIESFFVARAPGGVRFLTSTNEAAGVQLAPGGSSWQSLSDRHAKTEIRPLDHRETLAKLAKLPVTKWRYWHDVSRAYIGPMAQDFHTAFGLGSDEKHITTLDLDGVALSALKGLIEELRELKERGAAQAARLKSLEQELADLQE
jgi:hypothetical protein